VYIEGGIDMDKAQKKEKIIEAMRQANKDMRSSEVADILGFDKKEVSKLISELKKEGRIISPKRCYYRVKEE
jgi:Mn-dependent DtxR family transcriptional regulator